MKFNLAVVVSVLVGAAASSAIDTAAMSDPAARDIGTARDASSGATADELWKRRGGGGGGARGGSSGGSSRGGSSGSSGSSRGSSGSGSKSSSSSNRANSPS